MQPIIFIIHVIAAAGLIALILIQHGKGADAGAAFGSGASQTMFGSTGSLPFLTKITAIVAAVFFISSLGLGYLTAKQVRQQEGVIAMPTTSGQHSTPGKTAPNNGAVPVSEKTSETPATKVEKVVTATTTKDAKTSDDNVVEQKQ